MTRMKAVGEIWAVVPVKDTAAAKQRLAAAVPAHLRQALRQCPAPVAAVSPIIAGQAVKGPTAKMMAELGLPVDAATPARHYRDFLDLYIADQQDAAAVAGLDLPVVLTRTLMQTLADRDALARTTLAAADRIRK